MRKYKLLKHWLHYTGEHVSAGAIFVGNKCNNYEYVSLNETILLYKNTVESNREWFEEIIEPFCIQLESGGKMLLEYADNTKFRKLIHITAGGGKKDYTPFFSAKEWEDILKLIMEDQKIRAVQNNLSYTGRQADFTFTR